MPLSQNALIFIGAALFAVVLLLLARARTGRGRGARRPSSRGPTDLRYLCAGCEGQFNHSKRTVAAWEKGTRRFYCNPCHAKWRGSQPTQPVQGDNRTGAGRSSGNVQGDKRPSSTASVRPPHANLRPARTGSGGGCLGATILVIAVPVAAVYIAAKHA